MMKYKYILLIVLLILVIFSTLYYLYNQKYLSIEYFNNNNFNNCDNEFINNQNDNIYILDKSIIHKLINQNNIQN